MILCRGAGRVSERRDRENIVSQLYLYQIGRQDTRRRCDEHARAPVGGAATNNPGVVARIVRQISDLQNAQKAKVLLWAAENSTFAAKMAILKAMS